MWGENLPKEWRKWPPTRRWREYPFPKREWQPKIRKKGGWYERIDP
ncbi:hypothetical protein [Candidatus Methanodesulfokora washburnensis]|nr:hypothetical protein [Candidatus Methanodesulfokores washburnensis]